MKSTMTTLLTVLGLLAVVVSGEAQSLGALSRSAPGAGATESTSGAPEIVAGYNYMHATNCSVFPDGLAAVVCILSQEGLVPCTVNPAVQNGMLAACQTGNVVAVHIINVATGQFDQFVTFTIK